MKTPWNRKSRGVGGMDIFWNDTNIIEQVFKIFKSQPYLVSHVTRTEKAKKSRNILFWILKLVPMVNDHQGANSMNRFFEICVTVRVMMSLACKFITFSHYHCSYAC